MVDLHLRSRGLAGIDPATGVRVGAKGAGDDDASRVTTVLHRGQLSREDVVADVTAVVATKALVVVGPGLAELVSLVSRHVRSVSDGQLYCGCGRYILTFNNPDNPNLPTLS